MPKNLAFAAALDDPQLATRPDAILALNELIESIALNSADEFRKAIIKHHAVWNGLAAGRTNGPFNVRADEGNNDGFLQPDDLAHPIEALAQSAAEKRVLFTLKDASEAQLEAILDPDPRNNHQEIRKKLFGTDGVSTFGAPPLTIEPAPAGKWDPSDQVVISDAAIDLIKEEAQRQLLIKKIAVCADKAALDALFRSTDGPTFRDAARAICGIQPVGAGGPPQYFTNSMRHAQFAGSIEHTAANQLVSLDIKELDLHDSRLKARAKRILVGGDDFKVAMPSSGAQHLADSDVAELRGQLGTRYLIEIYSSAPSSRLNHLETIAKSANAATLGNAIKRMPENGPYLDQAVTDHTLASIRQAAASQALKLKIDVCENEAALDALIVVKDNKELKQALVAESTLGYSEATAAPFREALTDPKVEDIVARAHIRKNITFLPTSTDEKNKRLDILKLLVSDPDNFADNYINQLASNQPQDVQDALQAYFEDEENVNNACEQALLTYLEQKLPLLNTDDLKHLVNANNPAEIIARVGALGLSDTGLQALITDHDSGPGFLVRAYAATEDVIRLAKHAKTDLSEAAEKRAGKNTYPHLLKRINDPTSKIFDPYVDSLKLTSNPRFPAKQKQKIQTGLVEFLIRNFPDDRIPKVVPPATNILEDLAKAADIDQFKTALNTLKVHDYSWVNTETMEQIQKAACTQLIKLDLDSRLSFSGDRHQNLLKLVDSLPLDKQRALLANPKALVALSEAKEDKEVFRILDSKLVDARLVDALVEENKYLTAIASIPNSVLAHVLVNIQPALTEAQVAQVTDYILRFDQPTDFDATNYDARVKYIIYNVMGLVKPANNADIKKIKDAFRTNPQTQQEIEAQYNYNKHVSAAYRNAPTAKDKAVYAMIAALHKTAELSAATPGEPELLHAALNGTYREFIEKINKKPPPSYAAKFTPPLDKQITPKRFSEIKIAGRKQTLLNPRDYQAELDAQLRKLTTTQIKQFTDIKLKSPLPLKRLAIAKPLYWLNPAFQAASKENAKKMGNQLRELSAICDTMVIHLRDQLRQAQEELDSLPSNLEILNNGATAAEQEAMTKATNKNREQITNLRNQIRKELNEYEKLQTLFRGDPALKDSKNVALVIRQGILATLKQAEEGKTDIRIKGYKSYAKDYPNAARAKHFDADWKSEGAPTAEDKKLQLQSAVSPDCFDSVDMVEPGKFREYTVYYETINPHTGAIVEVKSSYIEERGAGDLKGVVDSKGVTQYQSAMTITANNFPNDPKAGVHQAMEMATRMIAARGKPPTPDDPILLKGPVEQVKYAWTALMIIGKNDPNMRFDENSIMIDNAAFNPETEFKTVFGKRIPGFVFASDSLYKTQFEKHPSVTTLLKNIKKIDELKSDNTERKSKQVTEKDTAYLSKFYSDKLKAIKDSNKEIDDTIGPAPVA